MKNLLAISLLLISLNGLSQTDSSLIKFRNANSVMTLAGLSHAAIVDLGNCQMIVLSGQVPIDKNGNLVGKDNLSKQTEQVFLNIQNIISEFGGTMDNLIKIGIYMVDVSQVQIFREVRDKYVNLKKPPTSTLVEVSKLFRDDVLIEIEATAIIPKK
jgi:2-iminobutanoate/2-iminopropanoate deaminase